MAQVTAHVTGDPDELNVVAAALAEGADRRRRTGIKAAAELRTERAAGADVTAQAGLVLDVLAEADTLERYALALHKAAQAPQAPAAAPAGAAAAPVPDPLAEALAKATAAVQAARNGAAIPSVADLAGAYNAHRAAQPVEVDGQPAWVAPGLDDDDEDLDAEALLELDLQP